MSNAIKTTITTESTFTIGKRNGASVTVDVSKLPESIIAELFAYGLGQKVRDASSAFPDVEGSVTSMQSCVDKLYSGEWTMRGESVASDPLDKYRVQIVRKLLAQETNATLKAAYNAIPSDEQAKRREFIMDIAAKNADAIDPVAIKMMEAEQTAAKNAKGLSIAL